MRVLIAGCGDVGNVLAVALMEDGHTVFGLKRDTSSLPDGVLPVNADLLNPTTLTKLPERIDWLVFMPTPGSRTLAAYEAIFIQGWKHLWVALGQQPARTLVVSSTAVFGESDGGIVNEATDPRPTGFNGKVLLSMEQLAGRCTDKLVVARISGIYGPGRERLISLSASGGPEVQETPPYFTNRIHRDDAAAALKHLLEIDEPHSLYAVTDDKPAPKYEVMKWLANVQDCVPPRGIKDETASQGKRVRNQRLRVSGFKLSYPDYKAGYSAVLEQR